MNFFSEFAYEKSKAIKSSIRTGIITLIVGIALFGVYAYLRGEYTEVSGELLDIVGKLESYELVSQKKKVDDENKKLSALQKYLDALKEVDRRIDLLHDYTAADNLAIINAFPEGTYLNKIETKEWSISITGYAPNVDSIPAIVQNLTDTGLFKYVYASQTKWEEITADDPLWLLTENGIVVSNLRGLYIFQIQCGFIAKEGNLIETAE